MVGLIGAGVAIFVIVFFIELPSRTNLATVLMATRHSYKLVWMGAALGFAGMTSVSVLLGVVVVTLLLPYLLWVELIAGSAIVLVGFREILRRDRDHVPEERTLDSRVIPDSFKVVASAGALVMLLEIGDDTQVLTIGLVAVTGQPVLVYATVTLGLVCAAAVGARVGHLLRDRVPQSRLRRWAGAVLVGVGSGAILLALVPGLLPQFLG